MISPLNQEVDAAIPDRNNGRLALYYSLSMAAALTAMLILSRLFLKDGVGGFVPPHFETILIVAGWINVLLIWRGYYAVGSGLMAVVIFAIVGFAISLRADIGISLAINITLLVSGLFSLAFPRRLLNVGMGAIIIIGVALVLADLFWPTIRPPAPETFQLILNVATGILLTYQAIIILRRFASYPLRGKLVLTFLVVTLIPLAILTVLNQRNTRRDLIDNANRNMYTAASQTAVILDDFFNNGISDIRSEASIMGAAYDWAYFSKLTDEEKDGPVGILAKEKAINLLSTYRDKDPLNIDSYALLDLNGRVLFEYPIRENKTDESDRSYFTEVIETERYYVSPVEFSPDSGEPFFHFSTVVVDNVGKQVGVLRARYKAAILQHLITRSTGLLGGQTFAVLFDENHLHLAHGLEADAIYKFVDMPPVVKISEWQASMRLPNRSLDDISTNLPELENHLNNALTQPFFAATDVGDLARINQVAVATMREQPWLVGFFQPRDIFLATVQSQTRFAILTALALAGVISVVAVLVAGFIAKPIVQLDTVAAKVAAGDLTAQAKVESNDEVGALARTFNMMTDQLRDLVGTLERRVVDRTRALEISSNVSQRLSTILDRRELIAAVVNQVQLAFDYYHAHIYLYDEINGKLIMVGGTGKAGRTMLANNHQLSLGQGLVGRAGQTKSVVLVQDVAREAAWLPNTLLPETKAEIAVPIISGDQLLGVLDVQQNRVGGLNQADADLLQSIANQVAVGLQNARLFLQMEQLAKREAQINDIGQGIQKTTTIDDAMQTAVRELGRTLNGKETIVRLNRDPIIPDPTKKNGNGANGRVGQTPAATKSENNL